MRRVVLLLCCVEKILCGPCGGWDYEEEELTAECDSFEHSDNFCCSSSCDKIFCDSCGGVEWCYGVPGSDM